MGRVAPNRKQNYHCSSYKRPPAMSAWRAFFCRQFLRGSRTAPLDSLRRIPAYSRKIMSRIDCGRPALADLLPIHVLQSILTADPDATVDCFARWSASWGQASLPDSLVELPNRPQAVRRERPLCGRQFTRYFCSQLNYSNEQLRRHAQLFWQRNLGKSLQAN